MATFVGRDHELALLRDRLADARGGRGQLVFVTGEPGIGKTRLAEQFASEAGVPVGWGRASEDAGSPPYWIVRQVLRSLGLTLPALLQGATPDRSPEARFEAFETVCDLLRGAAEPTGLVAVFDDLQWGDAASLALLVHLARSLSPSRLMVVATYRDTETTGRAALASALAALAHESGLSRLRLVGLTVPEVARQLAAVTGADVSAEEAQRISQRTGGNPFFVSELGRLARDGTDRLPEAVLDTVRAQLARLSEPARAVVAAAAVVSSELDPAALADVTERPVDDVLSALDEAAAAGILDDRQGWRFGHDLIRESARLDVATPARLAAHARMAAWLESRPDAIGHASEIAHHWLESLPVGDVARAGLWAQRAADQALAQLAWERAAHLYDRALRSAEMTPAQRSRLLLGRGVAQLRGGDVRDAATSLSEAAAAAREAGDPAALAEVALAYEGFSDPWGAFTGRRLAAEALETMPAGDDRLRARVLALHAGEAGFFGGTEPERASAEALAMAERLGDPDALRSALRARQMVRSGADGVAERYELGNRMLALGQADGDDDAALWGRLWRFDALAMLGRLDEAESELVALEALAARLRRPLARWHYLRAKAAIDLSRGRFADAVAATQAEAGLVAGRTHDSLHGVPLTVLAVVSSLTGRRDIFSPADFELIHGSAPPFTHAMLALYWLRLGDLESAERFYRTAGPPGDVPVPARLSLGCTFIEVATALGRPEDTAAAVEFIRPYPDLFATGGAGALMIFGSVRAYLGIAAAAAGRLDDAVRELRRGIEADERANTPPFAALAQLELAKTLVRRKRPGDLDEAAALAAAARSTAERLGMAPLLRDAEALARTLRGDDPGPLTRREREVAEHVAKGLTNKQVAALLHISERTAESHVQHVLTKLGLVNRTQLAAWLATQGVRTRRP